LIYLELYLLAGLLFLMALDKATGRIRLKLNTVASDLQMDMLDKQVMMSHRTAKIVTLLANWLFWPILLGTLAVNKLKGGKVNDK
jgi:hypothetical protein